MKVTTVLQPGFPILVCALALCAGNAWNTKDSAAWTREEINRILTDSPWAKATKVSIEAPATEGRRGMGGGGTGRPTISIGGPLGGSIGLPGGGMGRGGMGRGGSRGPGGSGGPGGGRERAPSITVLVRWDSAKPIQLALARQADNAPLPSGAASHPQPADKYYVISVIGFQMPERQGSREEDRGAGSSSDTRSRRGSPDPEQMRERLMDLSQLVRMNKRPIAPDDVKVTLRDGAADIQFLFPKERPISAGDREVTFSMESGGTKVERKFRLKEMKYKGNLEL